MGTRSDTTEMDIYEVVKPFYVLSRLVGFSWFVLPSYKWKLPKFVDAILMVANVSLRLGCIYLTMTDFNFTLAESMGLLLNEIFVVTGPIAWLITIAVGWCNQPQCLAILSALAQFDRQFRGTLTSPAINHQRHKRALWIYTATLVAIVPLASFFSYWNCVGICKMSLDILANSIVSVILYEVSISHIILSTWAVLKRLRLLNGAFEMDCKKWQSTSQLPREHTCTSKVAYYRTLYEVLYSTIESVNACYAWFGFFCIGIGFLAIMSTLFFTYEMAKIYGTILTRITIPNVLWLLLFNAFVVAIVNINDKMKQEVRSTHKKLMNQIELRFISGTPALPGEANCPNHPSQHQCSWKGLLLHL